jgi:hypothetical protein
METWTEKWTWTLDLDLDLDLDLKPVENIWY